MKAASLGMRIVVVAACAIGVAACVNSQKVAAVSDAPLDLPGDIEAATESCTSACLYAGSELSPEVIDAWKYYRSYYALLAIVEKNGLTPHGWDESYPSKAQIIACLGEPLLASSGIILQESNLVWDAEIHDRANTTFVPSKDWFYPSVRKESGGNIMSLGLNQKGSRPSVLVFRFDTKDHLQLLGWTTLSVATIAVHAVEGVSPVQAHSTYLQLLADKERWQKTVDPEVWHAWHQHSSYYALIEILDTCFGRSNCVGMSKETVRKILGEPRRYYADPDYDKDAFEGNCWMYTSDRSLPSGTLLLMEFDGNGKVTPEGRCWLSE